MKLHFELTLDDLLAYNDYIQKTRGNRLKSYIIWGLLGAYSVYLLYSEIRRGLDWATFVILGFTILICYYLSRRLRNPGRTVTKKVVKQNPNMVGNRSIEYSEDSIIYYTPSTTSNYHRSSFIGIEETDKHLYLFNGKTSAIILPKRAFANSDEMEALKNWVTSFENE